MQSFEYYVEVFRSNEEKRVNIDMVKINSLGKLGWEMCGQIINEDGGEIAIWFKRPLNN